MSTLLGSPLVDGNRVDTFDQREAVFPAMLAAIRSAKKSITFETYIYWSGKVGREFAAFIDNWLKVTGAVLDGADYFPAESPAGNDVAQVFKSSRDDGSESMHLAR